MTFICHFTHVENLVEIVARREVCCHRDAGCLRDIADRDIKERRQRIAVPIAPHGFVGDYVPFYFAPRSPMLFRLQREGIDPDDLVYLVSSSEAVTAAGLQAVVTDGNAASSLTAFHPADKLDDAVDWNLMRAKMWADTPEDPDRRRRRQAELLVHRRVPLELIAEFVVRNEPLRCRVAAMIAGVTDRPVVCRPMWYFEP